MGADLSNGKLHTSWYVGDDIDPLARWLDTEGRVKLRLAPYIDKDGQAVHRLIENDTGQMISVTSRHLPAVGIWSNKVRGVAHHQEDCEAGDFQAGARLILVREPANVYDSNAIAVSDQTGRFVAGYLNKRLARQLSERLDAGEDLVAVSIRGSAPGQTTTAVHVVMTDASTMALLESGRDPGWPVMVFEH